jgi:neutral ceramidase
MCRSAVVACALLAVCSARLLAELRVGAAATKITPPLGLPMAGYYQARGADGVLDDLYARTLVIEQDGTKAAFVVLDLISTTRSLVEQARAEIEKRTGVKAASVMISATHTHTGPELKGRGRRTDDLTAADEPLAKYVERLPSMIAESVKQAETNLAPARLTAAIGREEHLSYNRRFRMRDGTVGWNPGKGNPNIVAPAGPIDPDVGLLYAETAAEKEKPGRPIALYVNFAMHPDTVGGRKYSADYPGALARVLAGCKGPEMVTVFANGACGNLNHIDVNWLGQRGGAPEAHRIGVVLGAAVLQASKQLKPVELGPLRAKSETVALPLPSVTAEEVKQANRDVQAARDGTRDGFLKLVNAYKVLDVAARKGQPHEVEVQVIALGRDVAWVSLPGEVFVELGLAIKRRSPFRYTMIAELANGSIGYIPDRRSYAEGNYEPVSARCAAGSGEMLVEAAVRLLGELRH